MGALFPDLCLRFLAFGWDAVPRCKGPLRTTNFPPTSQGLWTVPQRLELPTGAKRWLKFSSSSAFFLDTWIWVVDFHPSSGPTTSLVSPTMVLTLPSFFQLSITPLWGPNLPCSQVAKRGEKRGQVSATTRVCLPRVLHKGACAAGGTTLPIPGGPAEVRACFQFCPVWAGTFSMSNDQESVLWAATVRFVQTGFLSNDNLPKNKQCFPTGKISQVLGRLDVGE